MRNARITIRASKEHIAKLNKLSSDLEITKTALLKKIIDDGFGQTVEITNNELLKSFDKIEKMLSSISNNLNQIARKVNAGDTFTGQDRNAIEQISTRFEKLADLIESRNQRTIIKKVGK